MSGSEQDAAATPAATGRRHRRRRSWGIALASALAVVLVVAIVTSLTPWPSAMIIRSVFERGGAATVTEMEPYVPATALREQQDVRYGEDAASTLDVFTQAAAGERRPTVVWVHGGAWISGSAENVDPYLRILAADGYTTVGVDYSVGPEEHYPTAITELFQALTYLQDHADELSIDPDRIVLAGDSAGAQLASQLAAMVTNPRYAHLVGVAPTIAPRQLAGIILNCGVYDLSAMAELQGLSAWGFKVALWAYTGTKDWSQQSSGATMSTLRFVTPDFPPTYISGGNGDGLTWLQSVPMAARLTELGVPVTELFWPATHEPALPHEYQFHLDRPEAREALDRTKQWLHDTVPLD
ncbi:alpha/beta hydrolase [Microbacterium sp. 1P10UB]|uniref:alpha/beta hydrolase n=1 Tax=unclassified Microbacterium TaxID=2609290 RepID=UPI00399FDE7F